MVDRRRLDAQNASGVVIDSDVVKLATSISAIYKRARSAYESFLAGRPVSWQPPVFDRHRRVARLADDDGTDAILADEHDSPWEALAQYFLAERIDPELFIRIQLDPTSLKLRAPLEPAALLSPECKTQYEESLEPLSDTIRLSLNSQQEIAMSEAAFVQSAGRSAADACAYVITHMGLELSPLFRYCLARSISGTRFQELAKQFLKPAVLQYVSYRKAYDTHWKQHLPICFGAMANRLNQDYLKLV